MFFALAVLLIQPAIPQHPLAIAKTVSIAQPASSAVSETVPATDAPATAITTSTPAVASPAADTSTAATLATADALPSAPVPIIHTPVAQPSPFKKSTVSVAELQAEGRRNQHFWIALGVAEHSTAEFDAWSTRHAITTYGAKEDDPLLRPFAGNASLYAAIQVEPVVMDYLGKKMMYSRHSWERHMWWLPQSASIVGSVLCGTHNMTVR